MFNWRSGCQIKNNYYCKVFNKSAKKLKHDNCFENKTSKNDNLQTLLQKEKMGIVQVPDGWLVPND